MIPRWSFCPAARETVQICAHCAIVRLRCTLRHSQLMIGTTNSSPVCCPHYKPSRISPPPRRRPWQKQQTAMPLSPTSSTPFSSSAEKEVSTLVQVALTCGAGVGKSSITLQLALTLYLKGFRVGVLDIDLTGPSMPRMLGLEGRHIHQSSAGWIPVYLDPSSNAAPANGERAGSLCCMSIGFLLRDRGDSVVWRGPKKGSMIGQFVEDVVWGELDYLLIDTPPGMFP